MPTGACPALAARAMMTSVDALAALLVHVALSLRINVPEPALLPPIQSSRLTPPPLPWFCATLALPETVMMLLVLPRAAEPSTSLLTLSAALPLTFQTPLAAPIRQSVVTVLAPLLIEMMP